MKRFMIWSGALALSAILLTGCAILRRPQATPQPRAFALAVTVYGSLQPSPTQWATIQAAAARELAARGWVLVSDIALADQIIRVDFTPDPLDPEHRGRVVVLEFRDNPLRAMQTIQPAVVRTYSPASSYTYRPMTYHDPYLSYYYSSYSDGYTYDSPSGTLTPVPHSPAVQPPPPAPPSGRHAGRGDYSDTRRTGISRHGGSETRVGRGSDSGSSNPPPSYSRSDSGSSGSSSSGYSSSSGSSSGSSYSSDSSSSYSSSGSSSYSGSSGGDSSSRGSMERVER